ncbi:MAG: hypothetical protein EZS28_010490 [Streblomastix strix]|uniref:Uncharacterized protein n=1 Tax=Streblomastix strix TaxID=222440 RepID=A0A5J4WH25_9EUKA|nr:MAG: hypothetical protein EZS28_010490 [Streblomastix strix]
MVDKENRGQSSRIIDLQNKNMHVNDNSITAKLESNTDIRELDRINTTRLLSEKKAEMTNNVKELKNIFYGLLRFEQIFKKMQDQAIFINSDYTTAMYDIRKWKAKESLIERIKQIHS